MRSEPIKTFMHRECKVAIYQDPDPSSPADWDEPGTIVHWHRRDHLFNQQGESATVGLPEDIVVKLPIWIYQHGGTTVWAGGEAPTDPWDSGQVGWVYMTRRQVTQDYPGWKLITKKRKEQIARTLESRIRSWDDYYNGRVYGYVVTDPDDQEESCWGYYADQGPDPTHYCEQEARSRATYLNPQLPLPFPGAPA